MVLNEYFSHVVYHTIALNMDFLYIGYGVVDKGVACVQLNLNSGSGSNPTAVM